MSKTNGIFIAATGQHVGKSTTCLGIMAGLRKRFDRVGFVKPVGQQHVEVENGLHVDKDVELMHEFFHLDDHYADMSPVLLPRGFTKRFLAGEIAEDELARCINRAYQRISSKNQFTVVEGTGHVGVGSIVGFSNAQVAAQLGLDLVIVASGGLGSAIDELALNLAMCNECGVNLKGVILNKVIPEKRKMILENFPKALARWNLPLLGCIPYNDQLSTPSMGDFEHLFKTKLIAGEQHRYKHFSRRRMVASGVDNYQKAIRPNQIIMTPATRDDIILATLEKHWQHKLQTGRDFGGAMILTGRRNPRATIIEHIKKVNIPVLHARMRNYDAMHMISTFTAKIRKDDVQKVQKAINVVEAHVNFDALIA
ncbi:MAG: cobyrinic acid a,c-diamide synthase [Waddliaceae bacterium]|nr:cobyrinic acid a,c-diamide synthase [Waddliaceae bacterium]